MRPRHRLRARVERTRESLAERAEGAGERARGGLSRARDEPRVAHVVCFAAFLGIYAYLLRGITLGHLYTFGDFAPFYGMEGLRKMTDVWVDQGLGFSYIYHALPAYMGAVTLVGGVLAQNLLFLSFLPIGYVAFVWFSRRFLTSVLAMHLAAFVYAINPLVIGEFVNGGVAALVGYAGLPILLYYLYEIAERDTWDATLKTGAVFGFTTISPWLGFWMVAPFAAYLVYRVGRRLRTQAKFVASGVIGVMLSLPSVHHMVQRALGFGAGEGVLESTFMWNYTEAGPFAVARLAGNHGVMVMNQLGYNTDPEMMIGLVIPGIALLAIRRRKFHPYFHISGAIVAFMVLTKHGYTTFLFESFPPVWSLRNPVKLQYPLLVCLSLCFGAGMETVLGTARRRSNDDDAFVWAGKRSRQRRQRAVTDGGLNRSNAVVVGVVLLALFSYAAPASGALGLQQVRGDDYYVPQSQENLANDLNGTVMWVPYGYTTQLRLRHVYPNHVGIKSGGVLHGIQNTGYVTDLFEDFTADPASVQPQLARQGVKYVVVEDDAPGGSVTKGTPRVVERWGAPWLWGSADNYDAMLNESDGYEYAFRRGDYTVYRVVDAKSLDRYEEYEGVQRLYYPETQGDVEIQGSNRVRNGEFAEGLDGWWSWDGTDGTTVKVVDDPSESGGDAADESDGADADSDVDGVAQLTTKSGDDYYPVAQSVDLERNQPYRVTVDANSTGEVFLFWYNDTAAPENLVARESYAIEEMPRIVTAQADLLSIRIRPNTTYLGIDSVAVERTSYPRATGFAANTEDVPGVVVDGRHSNASVGTGVAVNLEPEEAEQVNASVRIRDAETVVEGKLVFDERYRQGAGVLLEDDELPDAVPDDARAVTYDTPEGTVLDYWVVGTFDDREVTVLYTSYDEKWRASPGATHFRAYGWANGYVGASPDEIRWTGGKIRRYVVYAWVASWVVVLGALLGLAIYRRRRGDDGETRTPSSSAGSRL